MNRKQRVPRKKDYADGARRWAEAEWEVRFGQPRRARKIARAWVGVIELDVMGGSKGYAKAHYDHTYEPPRSVILPAAHGISMSGFGFQVSFLPAGSSFHFFKEHLGEVTQQLGQVPCLAVDEKGEEFKTVLLEDRILITWHTQLGPLFLEPGYVPPFNTFLLRADGTEHETCRVTTRIVAVFPTKKEAAAWTKQRSAELKGEHDRNHERLAEEMVEKRLSRQHV